MSRLIDEADARRRIVAFATGLHSEVLPVDTVMMLLTQLETIDAVPVVRCGECTHLEKDDGLYGGRMCLVRGSSGYCRDDDFCSCGKRRDEQ